MNLTPRLGAVSPARCIQVFVTANLAFLALDVWIAHLTNEFAQRVEWLPILVSSLGAALLVPGLFNRKIHARSRYLDYAIGASSIGVGVAGMVLHLKSAFFERETLHDLVYAAPCVAPLSFVGIGLLVLLLRLETHESFEFGAWVVFLAMAGFFGNTALGLLDHAQNGFFNVAEWIPVGSAAFAGAFLLVALVHPERPYLRGCLGVLGVQVAVGVMGFVLHFLANQKRPGENLLARTVHGAPIFAPLLFPNLALLAAIGIWAMLRAGIPASPRSSVTGIGNR
jgi:hypothetical protein